MLDFGDFLEYSTSNLPNPFSIDQIASRHCHYYQGFPGSYDNPHFDNMFGKFSIMAAFLAREENHLWLTVQFKTETHDTEANQGRVIDLVGSHNFWFESLSLHLVALDKDELAQQFATKVKAVGPLPVDPMSEPWLDGLLELMKARLTSPFSGHTDRYTIASVFRKDGYTVMYGGGFWREIAANVDDVIKKRGIPPELQNNRAAKYFASEKERVGRTEELFERDMADRFEVVRLMRFLPSYFDFMYDLVVDEKRQVGVRTVTETMRKTRKKKKVEKPIFQIIKSLRISYIAEQEARIRLKVAPRKWTAPSYRFPVEGHWRHFSNSSWHGHDQNGKPIPGRTWVKEYTKGHETEALVIDSKNPNVVIQLKQPLSYARDVIESHKAAQTALATAPEPGKPRSEKPSEEWMYQERIKLSTGLRNIILRRDGFKCKLCGRGAEDGVKLHVDHIVAIANWGRTVETNLRTLCAQCNIGKGSQSD